MATVKDELIELVRDLDDNGAAEVLNYVRWLLSVEDEPLTPEERSEVEQAEADIARGDYVTLDELEQKLGLQQRRVPYEVRLHRLAAAYLSRLDRQAQERMRERLRLLATDPFDFPAFEASTASRRLGGGRRTRPYPPRS